MKTRILNGVIYLCFFSLLMYGCGIKWNNARLKDQTIYADYSSESLTTLPVPLIHDMINGYKNNQLKYIQDGITKNDKSFKDAHSIWFDLETLKKFIYQIENETIKNDKTKSSKDLGIRIYYATYPEDTLWNSAEYGNEFDDFQNHPEKKQYGKHHTLVMIPTRKEKGKRGLLNIDFNPSDPDTYTQSLLKLPKYARTSREQLASGARSFAFMSLSTAAQNHGSLIPPRDPSLGEEAF